ncbi:hypothetical protein ACOIC7_29120, partial [Klebsiella pneumoniae]|uniref:hypothetical protein n=1 Tax=Klebsiella pneumoniae TaxID=573 RepID=UPI003B5ACF58
LHGWSADAIPPDLVDVPGGLEYSAACDARGPEERSICHVHSSSAADDLWWFGAECNHISDLKPDDRHHADEAQRLGIAQTYRTPAEVFTRWE